MRKGLNTAEPPKWPLSATVSLALISDRRSGFLNPTAGHLLGEYAETTADELSSTPFYRMGDRIGRSGLEKVYELELRGVKAENP